LRLLKLLALELLLPLLSAVSVTVAAGEPYPARPVRFIISFAAGGGADIVARLVAKGLSDRLGQQVVTDNRAGAGGSIGAELGARAAPDGYTLTFVAASFTMQPALRKLPYDPVKSLCRYRGSGRAITSSSSPRFPPVQ
jgi:tripartite-type tricarboxylate transporter receptor subunit TctC